MPQQVAVDADVLVRAPLDSALDRTSAAWVFGPARPVFNDPAVGAARPFTISLTVRPARSIQDHVSNKEAASAAVRSDGPDRRVFEHRAGEPGR
ncbi:hypothetical protein ACFVY4_12060 [Streptomyces sp. NPDC058299]|uniref:hypothetical protein n=1 Tax=Streptomyces sp. NPDC058299 TaxID=3346435 RepID=UPI0036EEB0C4